MHKKIVADLVGLAESILQMQKSGDVVALHKKAQEIYEKLTVLKFVEGHINEIPDSDNKDIEEDSDTNFENESATPENSENVKISENEAVIDEKIVIGVIDEDLVSDFFEIDSEIEKEESSDLFSIQETLEIEFKDAISSDEATRFFENASKIPTISEEEIEVKKELKKLSLNDSLFKNNIQVGLNDRIAFVKYLFNDSQEDFNRVLSQLNSFKSEQESKNFISYIVKPDYDWSNQTDYEQRLIELIERKFL